MALFRRGPGAEATYARIIDGEHLWLDVRGDGPLVLRGRGVEVEVDTDPFPLAAAVAEVGAEELELRLLADGRPVSHVAPAPGGPGLANPPTRDRRWRFSVEAADGELLVRRTRLAPTVPVIGFAVTDRGVEIRVDTDAGAAQLVTDGEVVAGLPVTDRTLHLVELPDLPAGGTATLRVGAADVVRARNALERPMAAVALPPLPDRDLSLRWTPEGVLSVRREAVS